MNYLSLLLAASFCMAQVNDRMAGSERSGQEPAVNASTPPTEKGSKIRFKVVSLNVARTKFDQEMTFAIGPNHGAGRIDEVSEPTTRTLAFQVDACDADLKNCTMLARTPFRQFDSEQISDLSGFSLEVSSTIPTGKHLISKLVESGLFGSRTIAAARVYPTMGTGELRLQSENWDVKDCPFLWSEIKGAGSLSKRSCSVQTDIEINRF